ncbi:MAG: hypothetical protein VB093_15980 [Propionicimonas sp.]|nr:hypothetical protein [Propionicimonas sp.]
MIGWAGLAAFAAAWLWRRPAAGLRRLAVEPRAAPVPAGHPLRLAVAALVSVGLAGVAWGGWAVGVSLALVVACAVWVVRRQRGRTVSQRAASEVVHGCQLLAGLLRVGLVPAAALRAAAEESPLLAEAAAVAALGGEVAPALRRAAETPGCAGLQEAANAWEVAERTGASMTVSLDAVADRLAADTELRRTVATELAASRATGRLLAVLPLAGLGIGYALGGDPAAFLLGTPVGELCLVAGVALGCAGLVWTDLLAERHGG